jgi:hypothetical protein
MFPLKAILGGQRNECVEGLADAEYRSFPALSQTPLKWMAKSPYKFFYHWGQPVAPTDTMNWGSAVDCLLFERDEFDDRFTCYGKRRAGTEWECFRDEHQDKVILPEKSYLTAMEAAKAFAFNEDVAPLIESGQPQVSVFAAEGDIQCKGRIDWVATGDEKALVELKTTRCGESRPFSYDFYRLGYDIQLGLYRRWLNRVTNDHWPVRLITVESEAPYEVRVRPMADAVLEDGQERGLLLIRRVRECLEAGEWPAATEDEDPWFVPAHVQDREIGLEGLTYANSA